MGSSNYRFSLDVQSSVSQVSLPVKLGDTYRTLYITLNDGGVPFTIEDGCVAFISAKKADGKYLANNCTIKHNSVIKVKFTEQTANVEGIVECEIRLYAPSGDKLTSAKFIMVVSPRAVGEGDIAVSEDEMNVLDAIGKTEAARNGAELAREEAENLRVTAETLRVTAESSRVSAESSRVSDETARAAAETNRKAAENLRATLETNRKAAETARASAETERVSAENTRAESEALRESAENTRSEAEASRVSAETARAKAETSRAEAEATRDSKESTRSSNEAKRNTAESVRISQENARKTAENTRHNAETERKDAEALRVSAEESRVSAETARATAEAQREAKLKSLQDQIDELKASGGGGGGKNYDTEIADLQAQIDNLKPVKYSEGLEYEMLNGEYSVSGIGTCTDTVVYIPLIHDGVAVTRIRNTAFQHCTTADEIVMHNGIIEIGDNAFSLSSIKRIVFPKNLKLIPLSVCYDCKSLETAVICCPDATFQDFYGVMWNNFSGCDSLTDIYVPWSEGAVIGAPWGASENCTIHYDTDVSRYASVNYDEKIADLQAQIDELKKNSGGNNDSIVGTWVFKDELDNPISEDTVTEFHADFEAFDRDGNVYVCDLIQILPEGATLGFYRSDYSVMIDDIWDSNEWLGKKSNIINILEEPTDEAFIEWLKINATYAGTQIFDLQSQINAINARLDGFINVAEVGA